MSFLKNNHAADVAENALVVLSDVCVITCCGAAACWLGPEN